MLLMFFFMLLLLFFFMLLMSFFILLKFFFEFLKLLLTFLYVANVLLYVANVFYSYFFTLFNVLNNLLSITSLTYNSLAIVIKFLVLWSIFLSFYLGHSRNDPVYLTSGTGQVFISLMIFLLQSLVLRSFLAILRYLSPIFSLITNCLTLSASNIPKYL